MRPDPIMMLALSLVAGCVERSDAPPPSAPEPGVCDPARTGDFFGRQYSPAVAEQARARAGAETVRHIAPGQMVTLEHLSTRLTLVVDARNVIKEAYCG